MNNICQELLLSSLTEYYDKNHENKQMLKEIIDGRHKLSLRMIDWLVTHYSKTYKVNYWINKENNEIFNTCPNDNMEEKNINIKKINLYADYRAQLKSYAKINFDSFRRHNRITFFLDMDKNEYIETTIGQLNFFRWAFNNEIIGYALQNHDKIYKDMIENNSYNKRKITKLPHKNIQEITKAVCTLHFD